MPDAEVFANTAFLGLARLSKRDPYRLSLFAQHLAADERPLVLLTIQRGTLLVTDRRLLELRPHLEVHGAWNVKEFQGYAVHRAIERAAVHDIAHAVHAGTDPAANRRVEDRIVLTTADGPEEFLVSRGPETTLPDEEFDVLRAAVLGPQPK